MNKLKIITIIGTRPEIIRLSRTLCQLDKFCNHYIVHTGQNYDYELNDIFFKDLEIRKPDYFLKSAVKSISASNTIGNLITSVDLILEKINPDAILILGDTNSCLAAIPAKKRKIPIFHMEAGNRCFDQRVPEEINRKIVDHVSDVNLTYSNLAREYLLKEGLPPDFVIKIGSPMFEVLNYYKPKINKSKILSKLLLKKDKYFVISAHREENIDSPVMFEKLIKTINTIAELYKIPVIVSLHPRTRKKILEAKIVFNKLVMLLKPLGFFDYIKLQMNSFSTLSDSGTISEESAILKFPALNLREAHERPEAMDEASVMMVGLDIERIMQGLDILKRNSKIRRNINKPFNEILVADYKIPDVSSKVLKIILSYTDYVNRKIWKKY
jgi:UDP-N-acetylglucosamine 2-epimerase